MYYLVRTKLGEVVSTNLPSNLINKAKETDIKFAYEVCEVRNIKKRHGTVMHDNLILYLVCYDERKTNKIFKHQLAASKNMLATYVESYHKIQEVEKQKTQRLKHNLITYSSKIHQELYKLIPQEKLSKSRQDQLEVIKDLVLDKPDEAATTFLRILKNASLLKAEFDVYDMLHTDTFESNVFAHSIHKVISLSLSSFWLDFLKKDITVNIESCTEKIYLNYESMSSILCHIFDNATKYVANNSNFNISFKPESEYFCISFEMISLRVKKAEQRYLFDEGFSSEYSEKLGFAGSGIGMNIIKRLCDLNKYQIHFVSNINPSASITKMGIPFDMNELKIGIPMDSMAK